MPYRYSNELSIKTNKTDNILELNKYLKSIGSRQVINKGRTRGFLRLEHYSTQGRFTDTVFELGDVITVRLSDSIEWYR